MYKTVIRRGRVIPIWKLCWCTINATQASTVWWRLSVTEKVKMFGIISVSIFVSVNEDITEANRLVHVASTHCKVQAQLLVIQYKYKYGYIIIHVFADQNRFKFFSPNSSNVIHFDNFNLLRPSIVHSECFMLPTWSPGPVVELSDRG